MTQRQCAVCGETKLDGFTDCPACGHPYPAAGATDDDDEWIDGDEVDDDEADPMQ